MSKKTILMETTEIAASRSAAEITAELVDAGATQIATDYEDGKIVGLRWTMRVAGRDVLFNMPARVEPVYQIFLKRARNSSRWWGGKDQTEKLRAKAERVAWRQLLRWVQAQIAMIDTGMVEPAEVFLPYMVHAASGTTLWQHMLESQFKMLPAPEKFQ